jgi:C1A family cysteine protease
MGTTTDASTIYNDENIYIDWAVINNGTTATSATFYTALIIDGTDTTRWYTNPPLNPNYFVYVINANIGMLSNGSHTLQIVTDVTNAIAESNESDNSYSKTNNISSRSLPARIQVTPMSITIQQSSSVSSSNAWIDYGSPNSVPIQHEALGTMHSMGLTIPDSVITYWKVQKPAVSIYNINQFPASMDWSGNDSPVKYQDSCEGCWAFAAVALVENIGNQSDLSEQSVISCSGGGNCKGGFYIPALDFVQNYGIPPESCFPYEDADGNCSNDCTTPLFLEKIKSHTSAPGLWGEQATVEEIRASLQTGPIDVTMKVFKDFWTSYSGGIYHYTDGSLIGLHAVLVVGYNDSQQCFKVKNSWGAWWGEAGYFRISYSEVTDDVEFGGYGATASGAYVFGQDNSFTIKNVGDVDLTVNSINISKNWLTASGLPTTPFIISSNGDQAVTLNVDWTEIQGLQDTATITIASNDIQSPSTLIQVLSIKSHTTLVSENGNQITRNYVLAQNYPNPFNPSTTIFYQLKYSGPVTIKLYDVLGREVKTLVNEEKSAGKYSVQFNGSNLSSGIYFYRMQAGSFVQTKKLLLLK